MGWHLRQVTTQISCQRHVPAVARIPIAMLSARIYALHFIFLIWITCLDANRILTEGVNSAWVLPSLHTPDSCFQYILTHFLYV